MDNETRLNHAFNVAEKSLEIDRLLDAEGNNHIALSFLANSFIFLQKQKHIYTVLPNIFVPYISVIKTMYGNILCYISLSGDQVMLVSK